MKILIVADVYPPEVSSAAHLVKDLAASLAAKGDSVFVLTTQPKHYLANSLDKNFSEFEEDENGIKVIRSKTLPLHKVNFVIRGISQLLLPFIFYIKAKKYIKGELDGIIVYSPPLTLGVAGKLIKNKFGGIFLLNIQDIFPQNAIDLGVLKGKLVIGFFELIEKYVYKAADLITFHSDGGRRFLIGRKNVNSNKIATLPNWVNTQEFQNNSPEAHDFREDWGLKEKFVFLFSGIMGPAQGLDFLIGIAEKFKQDKEVVFLLVGGGMEKARLEEVVKEKGLKNIIFKNFVSKDEYPGLVSTADVCLVCLNANNKTPFIPGKFLGYMAGGKPILAFLNKESDGFDLIQKSGCGFAVSSGDLEASVAATRRIKSLSRKELKDMGEKGMIYAKENFSVDSIAEKIRGFISSAKQR